MKLKEIQRTATFAWGTSASSLPLLATGTISGALDETFSNVGHLEIWAPEFFGADSEEGLELGGEGQPGPKGSISTNARFNRLAWSSPSSANPRGVLASGMETGEVSVWDAEKILNGSDASASLLFKNETHTGPVRGLDFNPITKNLLASGSVNAEIKVYDLNNPDKIHQTGPRSQKLDEITSLKWNPVVPHILSASSSSGYTSVWDLRQKKEVISLAYGGGAATGMTGHPTGIGGFGGMQVGNKRGMSDVCWQPAHSTRLITASEDDTSPIIMVWDLRNSLAPEKILSGHDKGILSLSWCDQDQDLLLSCGKDNRTICWNPQTCEIVGELPPSNNWSFQTSWCPRNPDLLATASFDGKIGIHSLQQTQQDRSASERATAQDTSSADDIFGAISASNQVGSPVLSLKQPPKWLRRPVSATFGFGGQLASVSNLSAAGAAQGGGKPQSHVVHLRHIVTEPQVIERAQKLAGVAGSTTGLSALCEEMIQKDGDEKASVSAGWKALQSLFTTNSRDELVTLLGFSKAEIASQVSQAIQKYEAVHGRKDQSDDTTVPGTPRDPAVTFADHKDANSETAETTNEGDLDPSAKGAQSEATPSEISAATDTTKKTAVTEADTEATDLFGGSEGGHGTPQVDAAVAGADFFSSMNSDRTALPDRMSIPHQEHGKDSSVAATQGSRASSVVSDTLKSNTFKIYPADESEVDRLITRALVVGDFESAVTLSLSVDRFADALVLAVRGGPELLARTQQSYFERRTAALPYLRLFQSIVSNDLSDVVQNAELSEWQEIFVVLCTFAKEDEFNSLAEQLGQRIEFQYRVATGTGGSHVPAEKAGEWRKNALLCYLAAGKLDKVVNIWVDELKEEEEAAVSSMQAEGSKGQSASRYSAHATALQTFMEKIAVFKSATGYVDSDLTQPTQSREVAQAAARTYSLAALYDRYYEYADLLATQGLTQLAVTYIKQTPADYRGSNGADLGLKAARERYLRSAGEPSSVRATVPAAPGLRSQGLPPTPVSRQANTAISGYPVPTPYQPNGAPTAPYQPMVNQSSAYNSYPLTQAAPAVQPVQAASQPPTGPYAPSNYGAPAANVQGNYNGYSAPQYGQQTSYQQGAYGQGSAPRAAQAPIAPPPVNRPRASDSPAPIPAAQRRDIPGWNDAPPVAGMTRPTSAAGTPKPQPIMSPFPNMPGPQSPQPFAAPPQSGPPRRASPAVLAPPPKMSGARAPSQQQSHPLPPPPTGNRVPAAHNAFSGSPQGPPMMQHAPPHVQQFPPTVQHAPPPNVIAGPPPRASAPPGVIAGPPPRANIPPGVVAGPPPSRTMQRPHANQQ
ncbi:hypothetical protein QFC22_003035 [Naganishia vaughanmartiniae]|uniref:Uncharacterized protein n=1 Tax=Naganishia vaughanmartiniae TaxID=1424756 RepID=A0ACC2XBM3_9TREE|nr:hypothetical protein QFC22_003035 [Naganishia vaughanmartiniae]